VHVQAVLSGWFVCLCVSKCQYWSLWQFQQITPSLSCLSTVMKVQS